MKPFSKRLLSVVAVLVLFSSIHASGSKDASVPADDAASVYADEALSSGAVTALSLRDEPVNYTQVLKTEYFDIIYPAQSERTARILAERVDAIYESIAADFETDAWMHIPVVISPTTQQANAYYSSEPYNRIVILDTPSDTTSYATDAESIVNTFYHELVHAVTANIHKYSKDNKSFFLGDAYSLPFLINSKLFFIEGATVSRESAAGEGRINSGETMSILIQSKLDDAFPSWRDITGPRDIYPKATVAYNFGGAFNWWLQTEYGMQRYADFWKECSEGVGFTRIFKKTYGITLDEAWELFSQTVPVPEVEDDDIREDIETYGFFKPVAYRPGDSNGIVYGKNNGSIVYRTIKDDGTISRSSLLDSLTGNEKELFASNSLPNQLAFSSDGRYLAVSGLLTGSTSAYSVRIYDMESGRFTGAEIPYSRNAVITSDAAGNAYIYCVESAGYYEFATLYLLDDVLNAGTEDPQPVRRVELPVFDELFDTAAVPGGAACLRKTDGLWYLSVVGLDGFIENFKLPESYVPEGLASVTDDASGKVLLYTGITSRSMNTGSETEPGALARLGIITLENGKASISIQKKAFSGGAHYPVAGKTGAIYSIGHYSQNYSLYTWNQAASEMTEPVALENTVLAQTRTAYELDIEPEEYHPLSYMKRGSIYPWGGINISSLSTAPVSQGPGVTWWSGTPDGTFSMQATGSILTDFTGIWGADFNITVMGETSGMRTATIDWNAAATLNLNEDFLVSAVDLRGITRFSFPLSIAEETFNLTDLAVVYFGGPGKAENNPRYAVANTLSTDYRYKVKKGLNGFSFNYFCLGVNFFYEYDIIDEPVLNVLADTYYYRQQYFAMPGLYTAFRLARTLPVPYFPRITVNWPLTFSAELCCSPSELLSAQADVTLFSLEIQKGLPIVPLYCNRFTIDAGCTYTKGAPAGMAYTSWSLFNLKECFASDQNCDVIALTGGMNFTVSPDIGNFYSNQFNLGISGKYYLKNDYSEDNYEISLLGIFRF